MHADFDRATALLHSFGYELSARCVPRRRGARSALRHGVVGRGDDLLPPAVGAALARRARRRPRGAAARVVDRRRHRARARLHRRHRARSTPTPTPRLTARARAPTATGWRRSPSASPTTARRASSSRSRCSAPRRRATPRSRSSGAPARSSTPSSRGNPQHPGIVHYLIHSFDYPELADLALPAARVYAEIAPASPHAQHMPSHIFTRLGLWQESIRSNLDSEASANAIAAKKQTERGSVRRPPRARLSRVRLPADRADRRGEEGDGAGVARRGAGAAVRGRLRGRRDPGALRARAAGVERRGRARGAEGGAALGPLPLRARADPLRPRDRRGASGRCGGGEERGRRHRDGPRAARGEADRRAVRLDPAGGGDATGRRGVGGARANARTTRRSTWRGAPPISRIASASTR